MVEGGDGAGDLGGPVWVAAEFPQNASFLQLGEDALARPGESGVEPVPARAGDGLEVHPVTAVPALVVRPIGRKAVGGDERAVYYFPPGRRFESLAETQGLGAAGLLYDESPLLDSDIARRIVFTNGRLRFPAVLYWADGRDLTAVDALVAGRADPEVSMAGAVVCTHQPVHPDARDVRSRTGCPHRFMGLVQEHTLPVPGIDRRFRAADAFIEACPKCSLKLMPGVLEILTETTSSDPRATT